MIKYALPVVMGIGLAVLVTETTLAQPLPPAPGSAAAKRAQVQAKMDKVCRRTDAASIAECNRLRQQLSRLRASGSGPHPGAGPRGSRRPRH